MESNYRAHYTPTLLPEKNFLLKKSPKTTEKIGIINVAGSVVINFEMSIKINLGYDIEYT